MAEKSSKYEMVTLAVLPEEKARIREAAAAKGITVSYYVRQCIEQDLKLNPPKPTGTDRTGTHRKAPKAPAGSREPVEQAAAPTEPGQAKSP